MSVSKTMQVKFVKKGQKTLLSFSKALCLLSGEWLSLLYIRSSDEEAIRVRFGFLLVKQLCVGSSPKQLAFSINNLFYFVTNPLPFKY